MNANGYMFMKRDKKKVGKDQITPFLLLLNVTLFN